MVPYILNIYTKQTTLGVRWHILTVCNQGICTSAFAMLHVLSCKELLLFIQEKSRDEETILASQFCSVKRDRVFFQRVLANMPVRCNGRQKNLHCGGAKNKFSMVRPTKFQPQAHPIPSPLADLARQLVHEHQQSHTPSLLPNPTSQKPSPLLGSKVDEDGIIIGEGFMMEIFYIHFDHPLQHHLIQFKLLKIATQNPGVIFFSTKKPTGVICFSTKKPDILNGERDVVID